MIFRSHPKTSWLCVGIALCAGVAIFWLAPRSETPATPSARSVDSTVAIDSSIASAPQPLQAQNEATPNTTNALIDQKKKDLINGLKKSPNYRAYIFNALSMPEIGGRFYATLAFLKCNRLAYVNINANGSADPKRQAAIRNVMETKASCDGVSQQFGSLNDFAKLALNQSGAADFLMNKGGATLFGVNPSTNASAVLEEAKKTNDPNLVGFVLQSKIDAIMLEGTVVVEADEQDRSLWLRAAAAVGCELTDSCKTSDLGDISCATDGQCDDDFRTGVRQTVPPEYREAYDRVLNKVRILSK